MSGLKRSLEIIAQDDTSTLLKVAFASSDHVLVDQHFGSTTQLVVYGVNPDQCQLLSVTQFAEISDSESEQKLAEKLTALENCIAVYSRACGASAVRRLLEQGVQPVKVADGAEVSELLDALQKELISGPSAWLAKAVRKNTLDFSRFNDLTVDRIQK